MSIHVTLQHYNWPSGTFWSETNTVRNKGMEKKNTQRGGNTLAHTHTHTKTRTLRHKNKHTHTNTNTQKQTHTQTHTHTQTNT